MTTTETTADPAEGTEAPPAEPTEGTEAAETEPKGAARDAARYRRQLRDTEAERDTLAGQLDAMRRAQVADAARAAGVAADAVWASGRTPADLIDDTGVIDPGKLAEALNDARSTFGEVLPSFPSTDGQGNTGDGVHAAKPAGDYEAAFRRGE
jgi:hypothetical protein